MEARARRANADADKGDAGKGSVLAVIGSKGAPGASECAASLAALAVERWTCVLVELDALAGGLDLRLGADPAAGLAARARPRRGRGRRRPRRASRALADRARGLAARPRRSARLRADARRARPARRGGRHASRLASVYPLTVCDLGFLLAEGDEAGPACRVHREAVVAADAVLLVVGAREEQLRAGLAQLDTLLALGIPPERLRVALNGVGGPGAAARSTLEQILPGQLAERRFALDAWLPWDGRALAAPSGWAPLARARRRGSYTRALAGLLEQLFLPVAPAPRERSCASSHPSHVTSSRGTRSRGGGVPWRS